MTHGAATFDPDLLSDVAALDVALDSVRETAATGALGEWARTNLGADAQRWLDRLPQVVSDAYLVWGFVPEAVHPASLRSLVVTGRAHAQHGGGRAVLKVEPYAAGSLAALDAFTHAGIGPTVLARSTHSNSYLLGWLDGTPLPTTAEHVDDAIRQVTRTVRAIAAAPAPATGDGGVPAFTAKVAADVGITRRLLAGIPDFARPFDDALLDHDLDMATRVETERPAILVHGDLIAKNTLRLPDGALKVIDPTPCLGPAEFDIAHLCARISGAEGVGEHLARAQAAALEPDAALPVLELDPDLLGWLVCHTARVYYTYKVAMHQDASGAYLRLVSLPALPVTDWR
jgi:hypothetical protein